MAQAPAQLRSACAISSTACRNTTSGWWRRGLWGEGARGACAWHGACTCSLHAWAAAFRMHASSCMGKLPDAILTVSLVLITLDTQGAGAEAAGCRFSSRDCGPAQCSRGRGTEAAGSRAAAAAQAAAASSTTPAAAEPKLTSKQTLELRGLCALCYPSPQHTAPSRGPWR